MGSEMCIRDRVSLIAEGQKDMVLWDTAKERMKLKPNGFHAVWDANFQTEFMKNQGQQSHVIQNKDLAFLKFVLTEVGILSMLFFLRVRQLLRV